MKKIFVLVLFAATLINAQDNAWQPLDYFIGTWIGTSTGKAGDGEGERTYEYIMNETFLHYKNVMRFKPTEKNPDGETHEDWGIFSQDTGRDKFVLRQFNIEQFVNRFVADSISADGKTITLTSEESENAPPGLLARLVLEINNENEFTEVFELSFGGKEFSCWMTNSWKRK